MAGIERLTGSPNIGAYYKTSAGAAFVIGDLVRLDAAGTLIIAATTSILGIVKSADPLNVTTAVLVDVIRPDNSEFSVAFRSTGGTPTLALNGEHAQLTFSTGALEAAETGTGDVVIQRLDSRDTPATSSRLIVCFMPAALQSVTGI